MTRFILGKPDTRYLLFLVRGSYSLYKKCFVMEKADVLIGIEFLQLVCLVLLDVKVFNVPHGTSDLEIR